VMAPNCSVRKNWHAAVARRGSEWTKRTGRGGGTGTGSKSCRRRKIIIRIMIRSSSSSSSTSNSKSNSSTSNSTTYSGADPGFARPEAYTILGALFMKKNSKLSKK
jgi:hypothetical protein